jgi:hypothetical protein
VKGGILNIASALGSIGAGIYLLQFNAVLGSL